jgi:hypothetical protein
MIMICSVLRDLVGLMDLEDLMDLVGLKGLTVALVGKRRPRDVQTQTTIPALST